MFGGALAWGLTRRPTAKRSRPAITITTTTNEFTHSSAIAHLSLKTSAPRGRHPPGPIASQSALIKEDFVTFRRLAAIALIFFGASVGLDRARLVARSPARGQFDGRLEREVQLLWGGPHRQMAPERLDSSVPASRPRSRKPRTPEGRVIAAPGQQAGAAAGARRRSNRRAPPSTSTWSIGARACCGTPPTPWRSRAPTRSATRMREAR